MCEKQGYCVPVGVLNSFMSAVMVHAKHQKLSWETWQRKLGASPNNFTAWIWTLCENLLCRERTLTHMDADWADAQLHWIWVYVFISSETFADWTNDSRAEGPAGRGPSSLSVKISATVLYLQVLVHVALTASGRCRLIGLICVTPKTHPWLIQGLTTTPHFAAAQLETPLTY